MKLSARNQLKGKIVDVTKGATTSHVRIEVGQGVVITASITNEAVADLALQKGDAAWAVVTRCNDRQVISPAISDDDRGPSRRNPNSELRRGLQPRFPGRRLCVVRPPRDAGAAAARRPPVRQPAVRLLAARSSSPA